MAIGDRIRKVRLFRGLTQRELGQRVGFDKNTADVRIAQYESGTRRPREALLRKMAEAMDVSFAALREPSIYTEDDIMCALFELDDMVPVELTTLPAGEGDEPRVAVSMGMQRLNRCLTEWQTRKRELAEGAISPDEYMEWKLNWPQTSDLRGRHARVRRWREDGAEPPEPNGDA